MPQKIELKRCTKALDDHLMFFGIGFVLLGSVSVALLLIPFDLYSNHFVFWAVIMIAFAICIYFLFMKILQQMWLNTHYNIIDDALVVTNSGLFGVHDDIYKFDGFAELSIRQGFIGKRRGYGNVVLKIPKLEKELTLTDINKPEEIEESLLIKMHESIVN